ARITRGCRNVEEASPLVVRNLARFLMRRLTLREAFEQVSRVLGIKAEAIPLPQAEAAVDVDKQDDLILVRRILAERRR
ncbi:MobA-like NTP transferase domain containing protein, partial [Myxococcota bacterium]|nr:MobA-like NTP transferase domain containing protein [Myxococcota bacterium]